MKVKIGNIFDTKCNTIVNTVNCVGVMGKGIALEFKKQFPSMFVDYVNKCNQGELRPGKPYVYGDASGKKILNFPTKDHWRSPSRVGYITEGLDWFVEHYQEYGIESIAFPPLGCGNGGLTWDVVGPIMYQKLKDLSIEIEIYAPFGATKRELSEEFFSEKEYVQDVIGSSNSRVNPKWYLILQVVRELNGREYALKVGRTIFQKICYVITRNGVDTGFAFSKGSYGPFSAQVKDSITALANANLILEEQLGRMISIKVPDNVKVKREKFSDAEWEAMKKTVDLFGRVKSTEQAEMIATVLFSYDQLSKSMKSISDKDVYDFVLDWKPRWKGEKEFDVCDTIHNMAMLSLMKITHSHRLMDTMVL